MTLVDGKKANVPKEPEAEIIKCSSNQVTQNRNKISKISEIANEKGFKSSILKNIIEKIVGKMNFIDRNVSVEQAIIILAKNGVQ